MLSTPPQPHHDPPLCGWCPRPRPARLQCCPSWRNRLDASIGRPPWPVTSRSFRPHQVASSIVPRLPAFASSQQRESTRSMETYPVGSNPSTTHWRNRINLFRPNCLSRVCLFFLLHQLKLLPNAKETKILNDQSARFSSLLSTQLQPLSLLFIFTQLSITINSSVCFLFTT